MTQFDNYLNLAKESSIDCKHYSKSDFNVWSNKEIYSNNMLISFSLKINADFYEDGEIEKFDIEISFDDINDEDGEEILFSVNQMIELENEIIKQTKI